MLDGLWKLKSDEEQFKRLNTLITSTNDWKVKGLQGIIQLQWSLLILFASKHWPEFGPNFGFREDRIENMAESAVKGDALRFAGEYMLAYKMANDLDYENLLRGISGFSESNQDQAYTKHVVVDEEFQNSIESEIGGMITCFISRMSRIIRNIRYREEDAITEYQKKEAQQQQQREMSGATHGYLRPSAQSSLAQQTIPPEEPRRDTEALFSLIALLFAGRPDAGLLFWAPNGSGQEYSDRLLVFVRWGADSREQGMIRAYFDMLASLAYGPEASRYAHEYMYNNGQPSMNVGGKASLCSWISLFGALEFYASKLFQAPEHGIGDVPAIPNSEVALLCSFLRLLRQVALNSTTARIALYENQSYNVVASLFGLLGCSVPVTLKAAILNTISAFCTLAPYEQQTENTRSATEEIARQIWHQLEQAQALPTAGPAQNLRSGNAGEQSRGTVQIGRDMSGLWQKRGGIAYELEELEAADETYPETRAFLHLLSSLVHISAGAPPLADLEKDPNLFSLASPSIPELLGGHYRIPGINPYIGFVLDAIFLKARDREYRYSLSENGPSFPGCLDIVERCIATMDLSNFVIDGGKSGNPDLTSQPGGMQAALRSLVTNPGFEISIRLLCGSRLLDELLNVLSTDIEQINFSISEEGQLIRSSVLKSLRIILRILNIQDTLLQSVIPLLTNSNIHDTLGFPLNLPRSITTLDNLLLYRQEAIVRISVLINATVNLDICLATVKILTTLADSPVFSGIDGGNRTDSTSRMTPLNRLVSLIDNSEDSVRILHGFITCLELGGAEIPEDEAMAGIDAQVTQGLTNGLNDANPNTPAMAVRIAILDLLIRNLDPAKNSPTISHWLLGFNLLKPTTTDLPTPDQRATCLHTVLELLPKGDDDNTPLGHEDHLLIVNHPRLAERCYHLIYRLYSDPVSIDVVARYLRNTGNFILNQLYALPSHISGFDSGGEASGWGTPFKAFSQMNARSWLFRIIAFELHTASLSGAQTSVQKLVKLLTGTGSYIADDSNIFNTTSLNAPMKLLEHFISLWKSYKDLVVTLYRFKNSDLQTQENNSLAFEPSPMPTLAQVKTLLDVDIDSCLIQDDRGCVIYDLHTLLSLLRRSERELELRGEINSEGARDRVRVAIRSAMISAFYSNQERDLFYAFLRAMSGWKEIAEILISSAWQFIGSKDDPNRTQIPLDLLTEMLPVFIDNTSHSIADTGDMDLDGAVPDGSAQIMLSDDDEARYDTVLRSLSPALVLLADKLQQEWALSASSKPSPAYTRLSKAIGTISKTTPKQPPIEKYLALWRVLVSAALTPSAQRELPLRGNIYAAILHYLNGLRTLASKHDGGDTQQKARHSLLIGAVEVLTTTSLGDRLLESVSRDAADAWDAWKTVSFSLLDGLASLYSHEPRSRIVMFMTQRNYFGQYIGSLQREDDSLQQTLEDNPSTLNPLYIYESKMAFFARLAQRSDGTEKLMENGIIDVLSDCKFIDAHIPSSSSSSSGADAFIPSHFERYHQMIMPALNLMVLLVTKIGRDNVTMLMKVAHFITQHYSTLETTLKEGDSSGRYPSLWYSC